MLTQSQNVWQENQVEVTRARHTSKIREYTRPKLKIEHSKTNLPLQLILAHVLIKKKSVSIWEKKAQHFKSTVNVCAIVNAFE